MTRFAGQGNHNHATIPSLAKVRAGAAVDVTAAPGRADLAGPRFEALEIAEGWTVIDLVAELLVAPRRGWSRSDAELVVAVLAERPGYAACLDWRLAGVGSSDDPDMSCVQEEDETAEGGLASHQLNTPGPDDTRSGGTVGGGQSSAWDAVPWRARRPLPFALYEREGDRTVNAISGELAR